MSTQPQQPTQPVMHEIEEHLCTFCGDMIEDCSSFEDTFEPKNAEEEADGYIHNHCIHARRAADLTKEERFNMVRLVAAMEIISEMSDDLLKKFDLDKTGDFELADMKETVDCQLLLLNSEPCVFAEPRLFFMRERDIISGAVALASARVGARIELENIQKADEYKHKNLLVKIKADRLEFFTKAEQGMREASYVA